MNSMVHVLPCAALLHRRVENVDVVSARAAIGAQNREILLSQMDDRKARAEEVAKRERDHRDEIVPRGNCACVCECAFLCGTATSIGDRCGACEAASVDRMGGEACDAKRNFGLQL